MHLLPNPVHEKMDKKTNWKFIKRLIKIALIPIVFAAILLFLIGPLSTKVYGQTVSDSVKVKSPVLFKTKNAVYFGGNYSHFAKRAEAKRKRKEAKAIAKNN